MSVRYGPLFLQLFRLQMSQERCEGTVVRLPVRMLGKILGKQSRNIIGKRHEFVAPGE